MTKRCNTILRIGLVSLAWAVLGFIILNDTFFHLPTHGRAPVDICFWTLLTCSFALGRHCIGSFICLAIAAMLLALGVVSVFVLMPDGLLDGAKILCFLNMAVACIIGIGGHRKPKESSEESHHDQVV